MRRVMGIDPGLAAAGYGVVDCEGNVYQHVADGTIYTTSEQSTGERLEHICSALSEAIAEYRPHIAAVEELFFAHNQLSAFPVAQARGVILYALHHAKVPIMELKPQQIKRSVADYGRASKKEVRTMVEFLLSPLPTHRTSTHAIDGLAIALSCYPLTMHEACSIA